MDTDAYLDRLGLDPARVRSGGAEGDGGPAHETVALLQRAHVTSVPFETLSVTGDPYGPYEGEAVDVDPARAVEKLTRRDRGGWCFELNGAFTHLLDALGADPTPLAARMLGEDGEATPPANHRIVLLDLDGPHVVDVGMGSPMLRDPLPLDGPPVTAVTGHTWRIVASGRPDADYLTQYRPPDADEWTDRYVFRTTPRESAYFAPTAEFLATAPESPFTDGPVAVRGTEDGHLVLGADSFTRWRRGERVEQRTVDPDDWRHLLTSRFGIELPRD